MGKKRNQQHRREKRRERAEVRAEEIANWATDGDAIPPGDRTYAFRARGGVKLSLNVEAQSVQGSGQPLTRSEVNARLLERAFGPRVADA